MPTSPSTSAHVGTPPAEAHALEGTSRRTSTRLNDSVGTDHLRDADHHFDRSSETQMTCAHDRQKDLCAREAQDRHDNARDRNDNARDRHDNAHDRHDNAHDRHDITRNRHDQPEHRYDTSHHETDSEEEEFKDAENDPPRKRPKGDEPETPARYTLRKRESNKDDRDLTACFIHAMFRMDFGVILLIAVLCCPADFAHHSGNGASLREEMKKQDNTPGHFICSYVTKIKQILGSVFSNNHKKEKGDQETKDSKSAEKKRRKVRVVSGGFIKF
ncbi:hypothetical protein GE061_019778 [Apolygus lucorum]|uniref:Uncharacterized protein n=1 Tax=Apolygus lucorum TaxID=248454 RepID=A0A8S9XDF8_APOLU|nr:hypothetical protein GE061_019778 [Apolygus lucorum]